MPYYSVMQESTQLIIDELLKIVGQVADVDRAYLFQYSEDKLLMKYTNEWCAENITPHKQRLAQIKTNSFPWFAQVTEGKELAISDVEKDLPADAKEEKEKECRIEEIKSLINVPVLKQGVQIGHLGFDYTSSSRTWRSFEKKIIYTTAEIIGKIQMNPFTASTLLQHFQNWLNGNFLTSVTQELPRFAVIESIAVGNPENKVSQRTAKEWVSKIDGLAKTKPRIDAIYDNTKIASRHLANPDFAQTEFNPESFQFFPKNASLEPSPSIEYRLEKFREYATPLVERVVGKVFENSGVNLQQIGKIVFVSSTGFLGPGLDCHIIHHFGLSEEIERANIGFMGCAAAMNGLQVASDYVQSHPGQKCLLVCLELSSVHGAFGDNINDVIIHSLFADGCAAVIIGGSNELECGQSKILIVDKLSILTSNTQDGIVLDIKNSGITCTLSKDLPKYIESNMPHYINKLLSRNGLTQDDVDFWAVHPGGTRIIESVQKGLNLSMEQTSDSWSILNNYGNMLSPSILYVMEKHMKKLQQMKVKNLRNPEKNFEIGVAFSFSPGVGVEGCLFKVV